LTFRQLIDHCERQIFSLLVEKSSQVQEPVAKPAGGESRILVRHYNGKILKEQLDI